MKTYEQLAKAEYDNKASVEATLALLEDPSSDKLREVAWEQAMPVAGCVLTSNFRWLQPGMEAYDDALAAVAIKLWKYFSSKSFQESYYPKPESHFSLLFLICRREIITTLNLLKRQSVVPRDAGVILLKSWSSGRLGSSANSTVKKLLIEELPTVIKNKAVEIIGERFDEKERNLVEFLIEGLVNGRGVPYLVVKKRFGSANLKFFVEYARVLITRAVWLLREDYTALHLVEELDEEAILLMGDGAENPYVFEGRSGHVHAETFVDWQDYQ